MSMKSTVSFSSALAASTSLHLVFLLFFLLNFKTMPAAYTQNQTSAQKKPKIIHAVVVDQKKIDQKIAELRYRKRQARLRERQRLARMKRKRQQQLNALAALKRKRLAEEQRRKKIQNRLNTLKQKRLAEEQQQKRIHRRLELMKQQQKIAQQRRLQRQIEEEERQLKAVQAQKTASIVAHYKHLIKVAISEQWIVPQSANKSMSSEFLIKLAPGGSVLSTRLVHSSGDLVFDRSAQAAILKASPLPVPSDAKLFVRFRELKLTVKPEHILRSTNV